MPFINPFGDDDEDDRIRAEYTEKIRKFIAEFEGERIAVCVLNGSVRFSNTGDADTSVALLLQKILQLPKFCVQQTYTVNITDPTDRRKAWNELFSEDVMNPVILTRVEIAKQRWHEQGAVAALQFLCKGSFMEPVVRHMLSVFQWLAFAPSTPKHKKLGLPIYAHCREWRRGLVRCMSCHPQCAKFAIIKTDDSVLIFSSNSSSATVLEHKSQTGVAVAQFRPWSASEIAIGCAEGIYIWSIDPNSTMTFPSLSSATLLSDQKDIVHLCWSDNGELLASCSMNDRFVYVWDVCMEQAVPLRKNNGGYYPVYLTWSPDSNYLVSAADDMIFRVWDTKNWKSEKWYTGKGRMKTACWSPCGSVLLYSESSSSSIYAISVIPTSLFANQKEEQVKGIKVAVIEREPLPSRTEYYGGDISFLDWDPTGSYLAVLFWNTPIIIIYTTDMSLPPVKLTPKCAIKGRPREKPEAISFQRNFKLKGANLVIVWSTGRIQYFPILDGDYQKLKDITSSTPGATAETTRPFGSEFSRRPHPFWATQQ